MTTPVIDPSLGASNSTLPSPSTANRFARLLRSDFVRKVGETYAVQIARIGLVFALTVLAARLLGPEGRGLYAVAGAIGALGVQFGHLGLHTSNTYFVAKDPECAPRLMGNTLVVSLGFGSFMAIVLGAVFCLYPSLVRLPRGTMVLALVWIPFGLSYVLLQNLLLGLHRIRIYNVIELINRVIPIVLIGVLVSVHAVTLPGIFAAALVALCISSTWIFLVIRGHIGKRPEFSQELFRRNLHYGIKAYLAAFFCFLVLRADLLLVQHMLGAEQAGYYSISASMADSVALLATVVGTILFPRLSALSDIREKLALTRKAVLGAAVALLPLIVIASVAARPLVRLLFGSAFLPASLSFVLLMPGIFFLGIHSVAVQFLNSIGYPRLVVGIWGASSIVNIGVNLWAIPKYGIAGAAVVSSVCYFLACVLVMALINGYSRQSAVVVGD